VSTKFTPDALLEQSTVWGDDYCISADEVALVEDLQQIQQVYSRKTSSDDRTILSNASSLDFWGMDLSQRLNDGDLTIENIVNDFRVSLDDQDHLAFTPVGAYVLCIERDAADTAWMPVVHRA